MKLGRRVDVVATLWTIAVILAVAYGAYAEHISYYYSIVIVLTVLLFYFLLASMSSEFRRSFSRFESLSSTVERWIRNEDIRRDLEVLPIFVEDRRREYLKGLHKGYEDISRVLDALREIKDKVESSNPQSEDVEERLVRCEQAINVLSERMREIQIKAMNSNVRGRKLATLMRRRKLRRMK